MALPEQSAFISWWDLQEASGTRADKTTNSNDLTDNNTVGQGTGHVEANCANFESTNTESLSITDASQTGLDLTGDFSVGAWINLESQDANTTIIGKYVNSSNGNYLFRASSTAGLGLSLVQGTTVTNGWVTWSPSLSTWYFVVATYDQSAGTVDYYIDGSFLAQATSMPTGTLQNASAAFYLGAFGTGSSGNFDGLMEQAFVANKLLSSTEISDMYSSGSGVTWADLAGGGGFAHSQAVII